MQAIKLETDITVEQLYSLIAQLSVKEKIRLADRLRAQAAQEQWASLSENLPDIPEITMDEIVAEVKGVRKLRSQQRN